MEVRVRTSRLQNTEDSPVKGLATISFGDLLKVRSISVRENQEGALYVHMPNFKTNRLDDHAKPVYKDICHPITKEFREQLNEAVLRSYMIGEEIVFDNAVEKGGVDVRVVALTDTEKSTKGLARISIDKSFVVDNIAIREGKEGQLFVAMPSYKTNSVDEKGKSIYNEICYVPSKDARDNLNKEILQKYESAKEAQLDTKAFENEKDSLMDKLESHKEEALKQDSTQSVEHEKDSRGEER